jgi:hypothetical protein
MFRFTIRGVFLLTAAVAIVVAWSHLFQSPGISRAEGTVWERYAAELIVLAMAYVLLTAAMIWHWNWAGRRSP